jgi:hypothetical protein
VITERFEASLRQAVGRTLSEIEVPPDLVDRLAEPEYRLRRSHRALAALAGAVVAAVVVGASLGLTAAPAGRGTSARDASGRVELQLASYRLALPDGYHLSGARSAPCVDEVQASIPTSRTTEPSALSPLAVAKQRVAEAASTAGGCVLMLLTPPFTPSAGRDGDPNIPAGSHEVAIGTYRAWLMPRGYWQPYATDGKPVEENGLVVQSTAGGGQVRDLVIGCTGLSRASFVALVAKGLSST